MTLALIRFGYSFIIFVTILFLSELFVRFIGLAPALEPQYSYFVHDPILQYRTAPNEVFQGLSKTKEYHFDYRHNRFGFRDYEYTVEKPDGVFRILGLGDSFTYGAGASFEDTYLHRLESMLNVKGMAMTKIEVIKAGIPRYFPEPERLLLQHYGIKFDPDLILVGFVPNDVMDTYLGMESVTVDDSGYLKTCEASQMGEAGTFLYIHSHLLRILIKKYIGYRLRERYEINWPQVYVPYGLYESAWKKIESEYLKMIEIARGIKAKLAFVHIPISPSDAAYFGITNVSYPPDRLRKWLENANVLFIDTLPAITKAQKNKTLYWKKDPHLNGEGHRIIAKTIYNSLIANNLVPLEGLAD